MNPAPAPQPRIFPSIRFGTFDRMARVNRQIVLDALPEDGVWTVPAHVADRANAQRQVS